MGMWARCLLLPVTGFVFAVACTASPVPSEGQEGTTSTSGGPDPASSSGEESGRVDAGSGSSTSGDGSTGADETTGEDSTDTGEPAVCEIPDMPFEAWIGGPLIDSLVDGTPAEVYYADVCTLDTVAPGGTPDSPTTDIFLLCPPPPDEDGMKVKGDDVLVQIKLLGLAVELPGPSVELGYHWEFDVFHTSRDVPFHHFELNQLDGGLLLTDMTDMTTPLGPLGASAPWQRELVMCEQLDSWGCAYEIGFAGVDRRGDYEVFDGSTVEHQYDGDTFVARGHGLKAEACDGSETGPLLYRATLVRQDLIVP